MTPPHRGDPGQVLGRAPVLAVSPNHLLVQQRTDPWNQIQRNQLPALPNLKTKGGGHRTIKKRSMKSLGIQVRFWAAIPGFPDRVSRPMILQLCGKAGEHVAIGVLHAQQYMSAIKKL